MTTNLIYSLGEKWGHGLASYAKWAVGSGEITVQGLPADSRMIVADWHTGNMAALAVIALRIPYRCHSFYPPGIIGHTMRGWLVGSNLVPVALPQDGIGNPTTALKQMRHILDEGETMVISVDGPYGPARRVRPGALWLARLTGAPIYPAGLAARPALHWPRWDRQMMPLPHGHTALVFGDPIKVSRGETVTDAMLAELSAALDDANRQAQLIVGSSKPA